MTKWTLPKITDPFDPVDRPEHYNQSGLECIDAMRAMADGVLNVSAHEAYCWQNAFKYLWRWPYKNGVEDLKKARWYLEKEPKSTWHHCITMLVATL